MSQLPSKFLELCLILWNLEMDDKKNYCPSAHTGLVFIQVGSNCQVQVLKLALRIASMSLNSLCLAPKEKKGSTKETKVGNDIWSPSLLVCSKNPTASTYPAECSRRRGLCGFVCRHVNGIRVHWSKLFTIHPSGCGLCWGKTRTLLQHHHRVWSKTTRRVKGGYTQHRWNIAHTHANTDARWLLLVTKSETHDMLAAIQAVSRWHTSTSPKSSA